MHPDISFEKLSEMLLSGKTPDKYRQFVLCYINGNTQNQEFYGVFDEIPTIGELAEHLEMFIDRHDIEEPDIGWFYLRSMPVITRKTL